jgi:hypothetical protein
MGEMGTEGTANEGTDSEGELEGMRSSNEKFNYWTATLDSEAYFWAYGSGSEDGSMEDA